MIVGTCPSRFIVKLRPDWLKCDDFGDDLGITENKNKKLSSCFEDVQYIFNLGR